ncbi:hypothetical protein GCM10022254_05270 [Actinomadura meridiana]|uniref:DUF5753 domain-containing protein n=1 Tax=Actinomadura meridiana TaxID=559626 RepID=A0ABP8BSI1_9ACTN
MAVRSSGSDEVTPPVPAAIQFRAELVSDDDEDFVTRFDRIGMLALPIGASRELIKKTMEQLA